MASANRSMLTALSKIGIIVGIGLAFLIGLAGTVYLSLRSPEVKVPDVIGQTRWSGEAALEGAGLNVRVRATRFKADVKADTILDQSPRADEVIKVGQTVAIVVSRAEAREGESAASESAAAPSPEATKEPAENRNASEASRAKNENRNKERPGRNANNRNANNKNANNRTAGNRNANSNANRNANRNQNANNRNANANRNSNTGRQNGNNSNRRAPVISTPPD